MIDDGETDWKLITLAADDDKFSAIHTLDDLEAWMPNAIACFREWLRVCVDGRLPPMRDSP